MCLGTFVLSGCDYYPGDESSIIWEYTEYFRVLEVSDAKDTFFLMPYETPGLSDHFYSHSIVLVKKMGYKICLSS